MKRIVTLTCLTLLWLAASLPAAAQRTSADWEMDFDGGVMWYQLSDVGTLVVATKGALNGIDPQTGQQKWKVESMGNLASERYEAISGSPLALVKDKRGFFFDYQVLDLYTGKILCNSRDLGIANAMSAYPMSALNAVLMYGSNKMGKMVLLCADAATGAKRWEVEKFMDKNTEMIIVPPYPVDGGKNFMLATTKNVFKVESATGAKVWEADFKNDVVKAGPGLKTGFFTLEEFKDRVWFLTQDNFTCFNLANGSYKWEPMKLKSPISNIIYDKRGMLCATSENDDDEKAGKGLIGKLAKAATDGNKARIMSLDYETGKPRWKEPLRLSGDLVSSAYFDNNSKIAVATTSEKGKNRINLLDLERGEYLLKDPFKVDGDLIDINMTPKGVMYFTTDELNILDVQTGKDNWAKSLKFKDGGMGSYKDGKLYIYGDGNFYRFDPTTAEYTVIAEKLSFDGKERPTRLEAKEDGLVVRSDQNLMKVDLSGKKVYHTYKKAPGKSLAGKILAGTMAVASMAMATSYAYTAGATKGKVSYSDTRYLESQQASWSNAASASFAEMNKRFKASVNADNAMAMLTDLDGGVGVVLLDKANGKDLRGIVLGDKDPDYSIDEISRLVIYKSSRDKLKAFKY